MIDEKKYLEWKEWYDSAVEGLRLISIINPENRPLNKFLRYCVDRANRGMIAVEIQLDMSRQELIGLKR
jgi:hypothetical protein